MNSIAVLGCAWGDEAKAKIADVLSESMDVVVRFQGGDNAGHTIFISGKKYVFHILPCGALNPNTELVIASSCVLNLDTLKKEILDIESGGLFIKERLKIYGTVTLITNFSVILDKARENFYKKSGNIGTTCKGIGPSYEQRAARYAIRLIDLLDQETLRVKLEKLAREINMSLKSYGVPAFTSEDLKAEFDKLVTHAEYFRDCIVDDDYIYNCSQSGKKILYEGAQGALLDLYHGSYPYVTSHPSTYGAILTSCGIGINTAPKRVVGVVKSYFTRVGNGPFPTYIKEVDIHEKIREIGHEYGASTGRPRNCGWLDLVLLKRTIDMNGITEIALTCIDVLCKIGRVKICTKYNYATENIPPVLMEALDSVIPVYDEIDLSNCSVEGIKNWKDLPEAIKLYISFIEDYLEVPVTMLSYGPDRNQIVIKK